MLDLRTKQLYPFGNLRPRGEIYLFLECDWIVLKTNSLQFRIEPCAMKLEMHPEWVNVLLTEHHVQEHRKNLKPREGHDASNALLS